MLNFKNKNLQNILIIAFFISYVVNATYNDVISIKINFAIISILMILLLAKLSIMSKNWQQNLADIVFLSIFFSSLFIPALHINNKHCSTNENRVLTKFQHLVENNKINKNFGKNFDAWFKDQFYSRDKLISVYYKFIKNINDIIIVPQGFYNKKTNFIFASYNGFTTEYSEKLNNELVYNFDLLNEFCNKNNIKLYIMIAPSPEEIIHKEMSPFILNNYIERRKHFIHTLQTKSSANIIYPYEEIKKESEINDVFFKTDYHWTDIGAYEGYKAFIQNVRKDFPEIIFTPKEEYNIKKSKLVRSDFHKEFHRGNIYEHMFPYYLDKEKEILNTDYLYLENKNINLLQTHIIDIPYKKQKNFYYPKGSNLRLLQIGTSGNENLTQFTPYSFKNTKYIRINGVKELKDEETFKIMKYHKQEILDFKPDIMLFVIICGNFYKINQLFEMN